MDKILLSQDTIPAGFPQKLAEIVSEFGAYDYKNDPRDKDFEFHVRFANGEKCERALAEHSIPCEVYLAASWDMGDVMFLVDRTVFNQDAHPEKKSCEDLPSDMGKSKPNTAFDVCPVCGSKTVDFTGNSEDAHGAILVSAECWACGASWTQRYVFAGNEEIWTGDIESKV